MIRSVLLALDTTAASEVAQEKAIALCQYVGERSGADVCPVQLTAVAVTDTEDIKRPMAVSIGGGAYKVERDEFLVEDARRKVAEILKRFEARCREAGIRATTVPGEGCPFRQIEQAARKHDLIMIGRDTNFHFETRERSTDTLKRIVRDHPRPIIVTPSEDLGGRSIAIAYDGSLQGSRALHLWILLGLRRPETEIHVVSVDRRQAEARRLCGEALTLLHHHGISAKAHPVASTHGAVSALQEQLPALEPRLVVMGAFGTGGLRERFFGATTNWMIKHCPYPLFLHQ